MANEPKKENEVQAIINKEEDDFLDHPHFSFSLLNTLFVAHSLTHESFLFG